MGAWGAGLYDDDFAADLRDTIALVTKVPGDGVRLAEILLDVHQVNSDSEDETTFWLVTADQFERRGIDCPSVFATALSIIQNGSDLTRLRNLDASERHLNKRASVLAMLASRLAAPRPPRVRSFPKKPPDLLVEIGQVYAFPTFNGFALGPECATSPQAFYDPNGWGALVVLDRGRAYEWLPWCALASLAVPPSSKPGFEEALQSNLIFHPQTQGAARCVQKLADMKTMQLKLIGHIALDPNRVQPHLSTWSIRDAIACAWSIARTGFSAEVENLPTGPTLVSLASNAG